MDFEAVAQQIDQIEYCALRIIELSAKYSQILSALERIGMTVAKDSTPSPVDRPHLGVRLVQIADPAAVLGQDVLHAQRVRVVGPADPNPVVALIQQLH